MTSPLTTPTTEGRWTAAAGTLLVLCAAMFLDALDVSMVGVALPSIGSELDLSTSTLQWIVSGYILEYGGLLLLGGRTADLLGRRQVFLVALGVFALASLLGGLVDGPLLIASRFIKGLSAAFTAPALLIITTTFAEGPLRNRALSIYTTCAATGFSMGLVLSGLLTEASWRLTMLLPAPIALLALLVGLKLLPRSEREKDHNGYDIPGAVLGTASMLLLVFTVVQAPEVGWASTRTLLSFLAVAVLLTVFVRVERRSAGPLIRLGVLRSGSQILRPARRDGVLRLVRRFQFLVTLYMQSLLGWSALHTALAFLPAWRAGRALLHEGRCCRRPLRDPAAHRGGLRADGRRLRAVPAHQPRPGVRGRDPADHAADRRGLRTDLPLAHIEATETVSTTTSRAWSGSAQHLGPGGRRPSWPW